MRSPDPSCPFCEGHGSIPNYGVSTVDPNMPGGTNDWVECGCVLSEPLGSPMPSGGVFARAKLVLFLVFIGVPVGGILLLQNEWVSGLFSTSVDENLASAASSQVIWTGEAECRDGTYPLIADSAQVPAMGESFSVVILVRGADAEKVLDDGRQETRRLAESMTDEELEAVGGAPEVVIPGHIPKGSVVAAVTLWGGGDATEATFARPGKVTGRRPALAPRKVEARFDRDEGTVAGSFTGGRCTSFSGAQ